MRNLKSVGIFPQVVSDKVFKEIVEGHMEGLFKDPPFCKFCISPLGVVPKWEPNAFRLIHHLSFLKGRSLNNEIDVATCSVSYATLEDAIVKIRSFGV